MDNKRFSRKISTIFWWLLTIMPFLIVLCTGVASVVNHIQLGSINNDISTFVSNAFLQSIDKLENLENFCPSFLTNTFDNVLYNFGIESSLCLGVALSWMVSVQFIHILFDIVCWVPRFCHEVMERRC